MSLYKKVIQHVKGHFFGTPGRLNFLRFLKTLALLVYECNFLLACKDLKAKHEGTYDKDGPATQTDKGG